MERIVAVHVSMTVVVHVSMTGDGKAEGKKDLQLCSVVEAEVVGSLWKGGH